MDSNFYINIKKCFFLLTKKIKFELKVKLSRLLIQFYKYFKQYN